MKRIRLFFAALFLLSPTLAMAQTTAFQECSSAQAEYKTGTEAAIAALVAGQSPIPDNPGCHYIIEGAKTRFEKGSVGLNFACQSAKTGDGSMLGAAASSSSTNVAAASSLSSGGTGAASGAKSAAASYATCAAQVRQVQVLLEEQAGIVQSVCSTSSPQFNSALAGTLASLEKSSSKCSADSAAAQGTAISAGQIIGLGAALAGGAAIGFLVGRNNGKDSGGGGGGRSGSSSITPAPQPTISQCPPGQISQGSLCVPAPAPTNAALGAGSTTERSAPSINSGSGTEVSGSSGSTSGSGRPMAGNLSSGSTGARSETLGQSSSSSGAGSGSSLGSDGGGGGGSSGGAGGTARGLASGSSSYNPAAGGAGGGGGFGSDSSGESSGQGSPPLAYMDMGRQPKVQIMYRGKRVWVNPLDGRVRPDCTKSVFAKHVRCRRAAQIGSDPLLNKSRKSRGRSAASTPAR